MEVQNIMEIAREADIPEHIRIEGYHPTHGKILSHSVKEKLIEFLHSNGVPENVVNHSKAVARLSLAIGIRIKSKGIDIDLEFIETAALLHDIGRSKTHDIYHGIEGAKLLEDDRLARVCRVHIFAGISAQEAKELGLPEEEFLPISIEEKIIAYADNLIEGEKITNGSEKQGRMERWLGALHPIVIRMKRLATEIEDLLK